MLCVLFISHVIVLILFMQILRTGWVKFQIKKNQISNVSIISNIWIHHEIEYKQAYVWISSSWDRPLEFWENFVNLKLGILNCNQHIKHEVVELWTWGKKQIMRKKSLPNFAEDVNDCPLIAFFPQVTIMYVKIDCFYS